MRRTPGFADKRIRVIRSMQSRDTAEGKSRRQQSGGHNTGADWRPLISQANSTNPIKIKVTDSGTPNLSATNNFVVTVNPVSQPALNSIVLGGDQVSLSATGLLGPDYTLLTSTNLVSWQPLFTTNPTVMPLAFADTNRNDAARFYRLQLGP